MKRRFPLILVGLFVTTGLQPAYSQSTPEDYRDEFMRHFEASSRKMMSLSEAVPEQLYTWSPEEGVFSIARVYAHIARYNFYYPETALGIDVPADIDVGKLEELTDKTQIREILQRSIEHVRASVSKMTETDLTRETELYGRKMAAWGVLFQLVSHMNEHVGQSVAYARMNGIVPPWSRQANM